MNKILFALFFLLLSASITLSQTGGSFEIKQSVVAAGGGPNSVGGNFSVDGTAGQNLAGTISSGGNFNLIGGFWTPDAFAPTAANVSISGRVLTANGNGIRNVFLTLTNGNGVVRSTQTSSFGYFRIENVEVGQTYILSISSKKYIFADTTRIVSVQDEIIDLNFMADFQ
jgi:hypothetical protein